MNYKSHIFYFKSPITSHPSSAAASSERANHQSLPTMPMIELIEIDLAAERIAVNSKQPRGAGLVAVETLQHSFDKFLFKFIDRFIKMDSALHHLANQRFQLLLHRSTLRTRVVRCRTIPASRLAEFVAR